MKHYAVTVKIRRLCNATKLEWFKQPLEETVIIQRGDMICQVYLHVYDCDVDGLSTGWFLALHNFWAVGVEANSRI